jgi:hypothetical protein
VTLFFFLNILFNSLFTFLNILFTLIVCRLRVQAVNGVGIGPASATFKCHTSRLPPAPPALEVLKASHNSLKVSWGEKKQNVLKNDQLTYCLQMEFPNPQNQSLE